MIKSTLLKIGLIAAIAAQLGACSTTGALMDAPKYEIDASLVSQLDQLKIGSTRRMAVFGVMGKAADRVSSESGQAVEYYVYEQAANTVNPLIAVKSMLSNNYGSITECRLSFDRRDILSAKACTMRQAGLASDGVARNVYPTKSTQQVAQSAEIAASTPRTTTHPACPQGQTALIIKSIKKNKDKSFEITYRNAPGSGNIPPEAGPFYKEVSRKKAGDIICSDPNEG